MVTKNDITGDEIKSRSNSDKYADGWEAIFGTEDMNEIFEVPIGEDTLMEVHANEGQTESCSKLV